MRVVQHELCQTFSWLISISKLLSVNSQLLLTVSYDRDELSSWSICDCGQYMTVQRASETVSTALTTVAVSRHDGSAMETTTVAICPMNETVAPPPHGQVRSQSLMAWCWLSSHSYRLPALYTRGSSRPSLGVETTPSIRHELSRDSSYRHTTACTAEKIRSLTSPTHDVSIRVGKSAYPTSDFAAIIVHTIDLLITYNPNAWRWWITEPLPRHFPEPHRGTLVLLIPYFQRPAKYHQIQQCFSADSIVVDSVALLSMWLRNSVFVASWLFQLNWVNKFLLEELSTIGWLVVRFFRNRFSS